LRLVNVLGHLVTVDAVQISVKGLRLVLVQIDWLGLVRGAEKLGSLDDLVVYGEAFLVRRTSDDHFESVEEAVPSIRCVS